MKRKLTTLAAAGAASLLAIAGGGALAGEGERNNERGDDRAEIQAFLSAPQDIAAAIRVAEAASGGKAVAAEFDQEQGRGVYEVDAVANGRQVSVEIDAVSGEVVRSRDEGALADAEDGDIVDPAQLGAPLAQLVATAEKNGDGKVMAISLDHDEGQVGAIEVELANAAGDAQEFAMTADGALTKIAEDHDDGDDDDDDRDGDDDDERDEDGDAAG